MIVLTGLTPILIIATESKLWHAIPPAIAAALAGLSSLYQTRESRVRWSKAAEALKTEQVRYATRAGEGYAGLGPAEALTRFVNRIEGIVAEANQDWVRGREGM